MAPTRQEKQDAKFDKMIQQHVQTSFLADTRKQGIEPSDDFAHKVMRDCINCEQDRSKNVALMFIGLALAPIILRELWVFLRNDYISVQSLPFGDLIYTIYHIAMSPIVAYILGLAGIGIAAYIYIKRWRPLRMERKA